MNCPACGAELQDGAKFCNYCGNKIEVVNTVQENKVEYKPIIEATPVVEQAPEVAPAPRPVVETQPVAPQPVVQQTYAPQPVAPQPVTPQPKKKKKFGLAYLFTIIVAALVIGNFFLPIAKATDDYMDRHDPDDEVASKIEMTYEEFENTSSFELTKYFVNEMKVIADEMKDADEDDQYMKRSFVEVVMVYYVPFCLFVLSLALILIFALCNKPGIVMFLDFVAAGAAALFTWVCKGVGLLGDEAYELTFGYYIYIGLAVALLICCVWSLIHKAIYRKSKRKAA